jgi:C-terminal peptidase prc
VRAGDIIVKVDNKPIDGLLLPQVVKRIRGEKNTVVTLTLRRVGEPEDIEIPITRSFIEIRNVSGHMIKHHKDIGYVKLTGFVPTSTTEVQRMIEKLERESTTGRLRGLVLDLRNNSGGLLNQAVSVSELFLPAGSKIVSVRDRSRKETGKEKLYRSSATETYSMPLVVLINDSSASASEIVASALQDNKRAIVVGDRSFGKASVQTLFNPDIGRGYYIKLTVARYYAPSGRTIQVTGVSPDSSCGPDVDKPMPLGFREENLSNHLSAIPTEYRSENEADMGAYDQCVTSRGIAEKIHQADPNPQLRFDYQLLKSADYIECMADAQAQAKATPAKKTDDL